MSIYKYKIATEAELKAIWLQDLASNNYEPRWVEWKDEYLRNNKKGNCLTFVILCDKNPVGQGTLIFNTNCGAACNNPLIANGETVANINALRIAKEHEGKGHISALVKIMEIEAKKRGFTTLTIGVEAAEARNLGIYLHWGYNKLITHNFDEESLVLYYGKSLC